MGVSTAVSVHPVILTVCGLSRKRDEETKLFLITGTASGYIQQYCPYNYTDHWKSIMHIDSLEE